MQPSMGSKLLPWFIVISAFVGFVDSLYLTSNHLRNTIPPCTVFAGCEQVLNSKFSVIGSIPVALLGVIYYLVAVILAIGYVDRKSPFVLYLMSVVGSVGVTTSSFFVYLQLGPLQSLCVYCLISAFCCLSYGVLTILQIWQVHCMKAKGLSLREDAE